MRMPRVVSPMWLMRRPMVPVSAVAPVGAVWLMSRVRLMGRGLMGRVCLLSGVLALGAGPVWAAGCSVSTLGINFGVYDVFSSQPDDIIGSITVGCAASTSYSIAISTGFGTYASRTLTNGQYSLFYNLFVDSTRTSIWGDGTSGTSIVSATNQGHTHSVYGRIAPRQNAAVGDYSDTVTVTVTY